MDRIKLRKKIKIKNSIISIIISIIIITIILINTIGKSSTENMIFISKNIINTINTNTVNNNIKMDILKKYDINDLITINYEDKKINNIDYNLESAYEILISIKREIIDNIKSNIANIYNYNYQISNNNIIIEMPFYNYTNNLLISNLGPKITTKLAMIRLIDGSVKTKITTYGINSLLVELYINFSITSTIVIPSIKEQDTIDSYDILISSKVIQGEIPSIYNGVLEDYSKTITT